MRQRVCRISAGMALFLLAGSSWAEEGKSATYLQIPDAGNVAFAVTVDEPRVPEHFRLAAHEFDFHSEPVRANGGVRMVKVTYPSPVKTDIPENNTVHAEYFQPAGDGPFPACVVLHILGGDFLLSETIATHLAKNGVASLFVKMPYYGERRSKTSSRRLFSKNPHESVEAMTQAVLDIRRGAAWLAARPEVDPQRLGVTGVSLDAIMSALSAAGEPRFRNVAIFMGGGNFADFIWANETRQAEEFRKSWLESGGTRETFAKIVSKVDPVTYGHLLKGRRVLMIAAKDDEIIIPDSAKALWESIGREPELVWLDSGHYTAIKYLPRELVRLDLFFNGKK